MFDIFYSGVKPNLFTHECQARDIEHARLLSRTRYFWWVNYLSDYTAWDFLWEPVPWQSHQRHAWASQWQKDAGTYLVPTAGYTETNYRTDRIITRLPNTVLWDTPNPVEDFDYSWHPDPTDPPLTYYFGTQWQRTGGPIYQNGADTIKIVDLPRAVALPTEKNWHNIGGEFDYSWHPDLLDNDYIYQFGTQHQRTGGPRYILPGSTEIKYVDQLHAKTNRVATALIEIDHLDGHVGKIPNTTKTTRYVDNYLDTLRRIAKSIEGNHEFAWICSSVCDYTDFDFTWHPEQWQATMLHVFASNGEKFGDTFFMHVPTFLYRSETCQLLEWYDLNFVDVSVPRRPIPVVVHDYDSQATAVKSIEFAGPVALFTTRHTATEQLPTVPLWREKTKTIVPITNGATSVVVPRSAISHIKTQLYDYPYIDKTYQITNDDPLDIVFISNGESNAEANWERLQRIVKNLPNRLTRVDGINGRVAAYQAALSASNTPWAFCVFAKLSLDFGFDWTWQPDRMQEPKHYIFHAMNPVNGLVYGHMAVIAYNKKLVMENTAPGLDFTLDQAHEVVPVLSGVAYYCDNAWMAWRTAFREVIKLKNSLPDVEAEYRLEKWLTVNYGASLYSQWSIIGAQDAVEYYNSVNGNFEELRKSYDWAWLSSYAFVKHNLSPD
jgi:hypothetical protein